MQGQPPILAAGAVVWSKHRGVHEVLVIHRPRYDDWTFPKGKVEPGEALPVTAVRETFEETGVGVRLGVPLTTLAYAIGSGDSVRTKHVAYWMARPIGAHDVDAYRANREVDLVRWVGPAEAGTLLSYEMDRSVLSGFDAAVAVRSHKTVPLVVLRHGESQPRELWQGPDPERTLTKAGVEQAHGLIPIIAAFGVTRVISSDSTRCVQTVTPFADAARLDILLRCGLSEEDATRESVAAVVDKALDRSEPTLLCTHRPVLPLVWESLDIEDGALEPGGLVVAHARQGLVVVAEEHNPASPS